MPPKQFDQCREWKLHYGAAEAGSATSSCRWCEVAEHCMTAYNSYVIFVKDDILYCNSFQFWSYMIMRDQKHIYNIFQHVRTRPLSLNSALNQCPRAWQDSRQAPLMTVKLWVKKPSFADPLDYTRIHVALLLHIVHATVWELCIGMCCCGWVRGTSEPRRASKSSVQRFWLRLLRSCAMPVQCRAMSRQEMHSCKFWRQRRWRESRLAPLGSTWLRPVSVSFPYHLSIKELTSSMARFDMEQRYLRGLRFKHGMVYGALLSSQFSLRGWFQFRSLSFLRSSLRHNCHLWGTILWRESRTCGLH